MEQGIEKDQPEGDAQGVDPILPTYNRMPLRFERGEGVRLITEDGESYLDFASGIGVNALGHAHAKVTGALEAQANALWHTSNLYEIPGQERLARRLCEATFADMVFFSNSGGEAVECALKMARRYHVAHGTPERWRIVAMDGAFHGRTLATIAAAGQPKLLDGFGPPVEGFSQVPFGDHEALKAAVGPETAAVILEPVQGEGGVRPVPRQCLEGLRALCDEAGILMILDEVQCGNGRTGRLYSYQHTDIAPDILCTAKGLGNGFPIGATLASAKVGRTMTPGSHGSTFGGNPLAMAVGNAVLDVLLEPGFLEDVSAVAEDLREGLEGLVAQFPEVLKSVRGQGLMIGVEATGSNLDLMAALREEHLLSVSAGGNVVRLLPPLILTKAEAHEGLDRIAAACRRIRASSET